MKIPMEIAVSYSSKGLTREQDVYAFLSVEDWIFAKFGRSPSITTGAKESTIQKTWKVNMEVH